MAVNVQKCPDGKFRASIRFNVDLDVLDLLQKAHDTGDYGDTFSETLNVVVREYLK